jgi:hydrogenase maturation protease
MDAGDGSERGTSPENTEAPESGASPDVGAVLIVCYGNRLRSDDGIGWHVAARLAEDPRLRGARVQWQHQLTPELAADVSQASLVVLVDASDGDDPGVISVRRLDAAPSAATGSAWSHHVGPQELSALARELWNAEPPVFVVSVGAANLDVGEQLSPAVERALPAVVETIVELVAQWGTPG